MDMVYDDRRRNEILGAAGMLMGAVVEALDKANGYDAIGAKVAANKAAGVQQDVGQQCKPYERDWPTRGRAGSLGGSAEVTSPAPRPPTVARTLDQMDEIIDALMMKKDALEERLSSVLRGGPEPPDQTAVLNAIGMVGRVEGLNRRLTYLLERLTSIENRLEVS